MQKNTVFELKKSIKNL